jgi:peptidoglycan/LPS O-acetylase OafA/YrhL
MVRLLSAPRLSSVMAPEANNFAALRLVAAVAVIVSHATYLITGRVPLEPLADVTRFTLGQHAVHLFFVLSGVMVAGSLERSPTLVDYARRRALRILPGLAACALVTAFLLGPLVTSRSLASYLADPATYRYPLHVLTLVDVNAPLPGVFTTHVVPRVNSPLWTLKYEVLCYGALGLAALLGLWRRGAGLVLVAAGTLGALILLGGHDRPSGELPASANLVRFWSCFFLGALAYRLRERLPLSFAALGGLTLLYALALDTRLELTLTLGLTAYGALVLATLPLGALRRWTNRTDVSYGTYIYGWPVSQLLLHLWPGLSAWSLALASIPLAMGLGLLSWTLIERPALAWKLRRRAPAVAPAE